MDDLGQAKIVKYSVQLAIVDQFRKYVDARRQEVKLSN